ncbi:holin family protein [Enterococcus faecalis]|uniref:phage holin family protein n=1 Tax=Enterococcus faecalis TaxID=1351 RepID=UPI00032E0476|nr:phage holin family protein [Enterococcus faecalis]EOJ20338.1 toxin secretion/phage lysis holin [Enterococcus faecalis EnGen0287]MCU2257736.1 phage holin family protein [Enterococcus faecalis]
MEKYFNTVTMVFGIVGGATASLLGGMDKILYVLSFMIVADYITGLMKGWKVKQLSSRTGFEGILKKVMIYFVIATAVVIQQLVNDAIPLREIVIMFYIANEGISLLENAGEFIPLPQKLKDVLIQLRDTEK